MPRIPNPHDALFRLFLSDLSLEFVRDFVQFFISEHISPELAKALLWYTVNEGDCSDYEQFFQTIAEQNQQHRDDVMTIAQQLIQKGRQEGEQKGRQEGERAKAQAMAKSMLLDDEPLDKILRYTGLSMDEIALLRTKH